MADSDAERDVEVKLFYNALGPRIPLRFVYRHVTSYPLLRPIYRYSEHSGRYGNFSYLYHIYEFKKHRLHTRTKSSPRAWSNGHRINQMDG